MTYYDKYRYLTTLDAAEDENNWWIAGYEVNGIFKVSKKDNFVHFLKMTESADGILKRYRYSFEYRGKIYFLPSWSYNVEVYDIELEKFYVIKMPSDGQKLYGTIGYIIDDKYIYFFSKLCNETPIRLNIDTMICERVYCSWEENVKKYSKHNKYYIDSIAEIDEYMWYGVYNTNVLICSLKRDLEVIQTIVLKEHYRIQQVVNIGENRLLISMIDGDECIIYNVVDRDIVSKISIGQIGKVVNVLSCGDEIVLIPQYGKKIMVTNVDTGVSRIVDCDHKNLCCFNDKDECFYYGKMDNDKIYLFPYGVNVFTIIDRKDLSISYQKWEIEKGASTKEIMKKYVVEYDDNILDECRCSVDIFLEDMMNESQQINKNEDVGGRIHEEIKKRL